MPGSVAMCERYAGPVGAESVYLNTGCGAGGGGWWLCPSDYTEQSLSFALVGVVVVAFSCAQASPTPSWPRLLTPVELLVPDSHFVHLV